MIISFVMAFVFRSYVVEPFRIPTGSMAPTLLGAHMQFSSPETGYDWTVNPRDYTNTRTPLPVQGSRRAGLDPVIVRDPMTGRAIRESDMPLRAGDRILVLKYLYLLREPRRYEVVVFKNPEDPKVNLIKRLVGLPGEEILIADGDVFARPAGSDAPWRITRKPDRTQEEVWSTFYTSDAAPIPGSLTAWKSPWAGEGWDTSGREYRWNSADATTLRWDPSVTPIVDLTPYNDTLPSGSSARAIHFPVGDLRVRARVRPDTAGLAARLTITARGHEFEAVITPASAQLRVRAAGSESWDVLAEHAGAFLPEGVFTALEFWHADEALQLRVDGEKVLEAEYEWSPAERYRFAAGAGRDRVEPADPGTYAPVGVSMAFENAPLTLAGVALDRDLYYRPQRINGRYYRATHPSYPAVLSPDQYFMLGDNSAASHDGRGWTRVNPWIGEQLGYDAGVVHRTLILGKAFMVYWPAPYYAKVPPGLSLPVPDAGHMRFIK